MSGTRPGMTGTSKHRIVAITSATVPWLTGRDREAENAGGLPSTSLKFEAYSIQIAAGIWDQVMKHQNTLPLPAVALQAVANIEARDNVEGQASLPWFDGAMLALESCEVIRIRLAMFATGGGGAEQEARLMVSEKINAMFEAGASLMAGANPSAIIGRYREHVAANARRLSAV